MIYRSYQATPVREEIVISSPHTATPTGLWLGGIGSADYPRLAKHSSARHFTRKS